MDKEICNKINSYVWCKPVWSSLTNNKESKEILQKSIDKPTLELSDDLTDIIKKSKEFPRPFPIETVRLETLKARRPVHRLKKNITSTYPLIHEKVLMLITHFLIFKRQFGSRIEKDFYRDMTIPELIDRLLKKRAVSFMGRFDRYLLISGKGASGGWEAIGTAQQRAPLFLEDCLSYDEIKLSALLYVSGYTECINDGNRKNMGVVNEDDIEENAVIIGIIGPRLKRKHKMDYEDILITEEQNTTENGYGEVTDAMKKSAIHKYRQLWSEFYEVPYLTHDIVNSPKIDEVPVEKRYVDRYIKCPKTAFIFDNEVYYKRNCLIAESTLWEAEARAVEADKLAYVNVVGAGLGVWKISVHQLDVFILTFVERIQALLEKDQLNHVSDVNFAWIFPSDTVMELFKETDDGSGSKGKKKSKSKQKQSTEPRKLFIEHKNHPKGGINVQLQKREPSSRLIGEHAGKLLVMTYPWDGNAQPGNEFWRGGLKSSGDPAAACSTQIAELHNVFINPAVCGQNLKIVGPTGVKSLADYCSTLNM